MYYIFMYQNRYLYDYDINYIKHINKIETTTIHDNHTNS